MADWLYRFGDRTCGTSMSNAGFASLPVRLAGTGRDGPATQPQTIRTITERFRAAGPGRSVLLFLQQRLDRPSAVQGQRQTAFLDARRRGAAEHRLGELVGWPQFAVGEQEELLDGLLASADPAVRVSACRRGRADPGSAARSAIGGAAVAATAGGVVGDLVEHRPTG